MWEYPELIYEIILNSDINIVKNNLSNFIINNFYMDYLSGDYLENNLLYIITLLLKNEIDLMDKKENKEFFLSISNTGKFLSALVEIPSVQIFFKKIILDPVENLERNNVMEDVFLNAEEISTKMSEIKEDKNDENNLKYVYKRAIKDKINNQSIKNLKKRNENYRIFVEKYSLDLDLPSIKNFQEKAKKEKNDELYLYYLSIEEEIKFNKKEDLFSNKILMKNFLNSDSPTYMLSFYQNEFLKGVNFIEQLISDFEKNILLMPKFIKNICKIISLLIKEKFNDLKKYEENYFISKFLFNKLLQYFLSSPSFNAIINTFVISQNTIKNINEIIIVLQRLFIGKLFRNNKEENNYTPYNWLILEKFGKILELFENTKKANLPLFIQKLINQKLPNDYNYDYFEENKEKIFINVSICFTVDNIYALISGIKKINNFFRREDNKEKNSIVKLVLDKLEFDKYKNQIKKVNQDRIESYLKEMKDKKINIDSNNLENYYLVNILLSDKKYDKIMNMDNTIKNFFINAKDAIKHNNNKEQLIETNRNLINLKNNICGALATYRQLKFSDFFINKSANLIEIFQELKKYVLITNNNLSLNKSINLCYCYISSVLNYINKIPEEYKENNYQKLFNELYENIIDSTNELSLEKLSVIKNKIIFIKKALQYYEESNKDIKDIIINENIKIITERIALLMDVKFMYNEDEKYFELKKSTLKNEHKEGKIKLNKKNNCYTIKTVEAFTKFFPNLSNYQFTMDVNPLQIINELEINTKLKNYIDLINKLLTTNLQIDKNQFKDLYQEKIVNYIFDKIYEKVYPPIPCPQEAKLSKIMQKMTQNDLDKLFDKKYNIDYNIDSFIPEITELFKKLKNARTPLFKFKCLKNILNYSSNIIGFNEGFDKKIGADDLVPMLNFIIIKVKPYMFISDIEYIKTFKSLLPYCDNDIILFESIISKILGVDEI